MMTDAEVLMHAIARNHRLSEDCVDCLSLPPLRDRHSAMHDLLATARRWVMWLEEPTPGQRDEWLARVDRALGEWSDEDQRKARATTGELARPDPAFIERLRATCKECGHRQHDHHSAGWCGADFYLLGHTACPCPGLALTAIREAGDE